MGDIWYMLDDHERYVYHYTNASTLAHNILTSGTLRFSNFARLNDPREYKNFDLDVYSSGPLGNDCADIKSQMEVALKEDWKIACFVIDPVEAVISPATDALGARQLDAMHERGHSRPRMWAQYADGHRGACLVFRKHDLDQAIRSYAGRDGLKVFCGPVSYHNVPVVGSMGPGAFSFSIDNVRRDGVRHTAERHIGRYLSELYLTKNRDWEAEREFRWLLRGAPEKEVLVEFGNSLVGIAIGELFPSELKKAVGRYALDNEISVVTMDWRRAIPQPKPIAPRMLIT
jgi:hypothetical protein